jgi:hypothetical protein
MNAPFKARAPHSDAVDECQRAAEAYGLVIELGQDAVQAIMVEAFRAASRRSFVVARCYHTNPECDDDVVPDLISEG